MTKWEKINNKRSHSHLSYSHPIPISLRNLVPIPMGIPLKGWESRISHSHAYLHSVSSQALHIVVYFYTIRYHNSEL